MPNYYEILELEATATQSEIKSAIDEKYAYWNSLASHHNPEMVDKAGREKRQLEEIRAVLENKTKRKKYDASLDENIGGLAEQGHPNVSAKPVATVSKIAAQSHAPERVDAWMCAKCHTANPIGQKFCSKCGNQIAEECTECKELSQISSVFCPKCGANKTQAKRARQEYEAQVLEAQNKQKIKNLQDEIERKELEVSNIKRLQRKYPLWYDRTDPSLHQALWPIPMEDFGCLLTLLLIPLIVALQASINWIASILLKSIGYSITSSPWIFLIWILANLMIMWIIIRSAQWPIVNKRAVKMIEERKTDIAKMKQEIRQIQPQS